MDSDIMHIIEIEKMLSDSIEEAKKNAHKMVEKRRAELTAFRESEIERIRNESAERIRISLEVIKFNAEKELEELRRDEEQFLNDPELRVRITGRIVSVILEK